MSSSGHWKVQDFVLRKQGWEKRKIYIQHQQKKVFIQSMWIFDEMIIKSLIDFWWFETRFIWPFSPLGIIDFNPISRRYWMYGIDYWSTKSLSKKWNILHLKIYFLRISWRGERIHSWPISLQIQMLSPSSVETLNCIDVI